MSRAEPLLVDGSEGEGGGQMVRTSLALSLLTGRPVVIENIRARRKNPGLGRQHLTAVQAAIAVGRAEAEGVEQGSSRLSFTPRGLFAGDYVFEVGTAGSCTLVLQTVLPALMTLPEESRLVLGGGTHNPMAPPAPFLQQVLAPLLGRLGRTLELTLERPGFYPAGGGRLRARLPAVERVRWTPFSLLERGPLVERALIALIARLPDHVGQAMLDEGARSMDWPASCGRIERRDDSRGPGSALLAQLRFASGERELVSAFGDRRTRARQVARTLGEETRALLAGEVPVGVHLADQWMLLLAVALSRLEPGAEAAFLTVAPDGHTLSQQALIPRFLPVVIERAEQAPGRWRFTVRRTPG